MKYFKWSDSYSVGVEEIDSQHKRLFDIVNAFHDPSAVNDLSTIKNLLADLLDFALEHFKTEEYYFGKFNYEASASHISHHVEFEAKIVEFQQNFQMKKTFSLAEIKKFLKDWIINHVLIFDKRYMNCFRENGLT